MIGITTKISSLCLSNTPDPSIKFHGNPFLVFFSNVAIKQRDNKTDRQKKATENIISLAEIKNEKTRKKQYFMKDIKVCSVCGWFKI